MSLHDIDKNSPSRESPIPNSHDEQRLARMANGTVSVNPITGATTTTGHIITKNQQIIANDGVYNKALLGYQQGLGKWGLFVAKDTVDVNTNTDLSQFILNSSQDSFKIVLTGTTSITPPSPFVPGGAGKQRVTIAHNLGVKPAPLVFVDNPVIGGVSDSGDGLGLVPNPLFLVNSYANVIQSAAHVDITNLYIDLIYLNTAGTNLTGANAFTWNYRYYLLQETAN